MWLFDKQMQQVTWISECSSSMSKYKMSASEHAPPSESGVRSDCPHTLKGRLTLRTASVKHRIAAAAEAAGKGGGKDGKRDNDDGKLGGKDGKLGGNDDGVCCGCGGKGAGKDGKWGGDDGVCCSCGGCDVRRRRCGVACCFAALSAAVGTLSEEEEAALKPLPAIAACVLRNAVFGVEKLKLKLLGRRINLIKK